MDTDNDWTATGLFSPSKAKAHQAQAKDWNSVDAWLAKRFKRPPTFERNEETLQALLGLAMLNDAADEQRSGVDRVEKAALNALGKRNESGGDDLHQCLLSNMEDKAALDSLADISVLLNTPRISALDMGTAIVDLNDAQFASEQQLHRTEAQLRALRTEQERIESLLNSLKDDALQAPPDLPEQTTEWTRSAKHLRAKVAEYDDRLVGIRSESKPAITFEDFAKQTAEQVEQERQLAGLENELKAFQSLPSDAKGARVKLETAREELRKLTQERDALFERMAGA